MQLSDLDYNFPEHLIATEARVNSRVLLNQNNENTELNMDELLQLFNKGDSLVINDTKVVKKRIFANVMPENKKQVEVLFLDSVGENKWQVLFPASRLKAHQFLQLPNGVKAELIERGRPQTLQLECNIDFDYFAKYGELPLPPYIQKARDSRHQVEDDNKWYQTAWAEKEGSAAAPTASLHFTQKHLDALKEKGVKVLKVTLHVGLGTFLPITKEDVLEHDMHFEEVHISASVWQELENTKRNSAKVWSLGSTVCRSLESVNNGILQKNSVGDYVGKTNLFIYPGFKFHMVDNLLTNFHQPKTTLLAMVAAFSDLENLKKAYQWAIDKEFKLFSYGDLSAWVK